jgi:prefoldin subunit 5
MEQDDNVGRLAAEIRYYESEMQKLHTQIRLRKEMIRRLCQHEDTFRCSTGDPQRSFETVCSTCGKSL